MDEDTLKAKMEYEAALKPPVWDTNNSVKQHVEVETSDELNELFAAMSKAQGEMKEAIKTSENKFFDSMYADYADIWRVAQGPNANNNITVMHFPLEDDGRAGCMTWVGHSSGQWMRSTLMLPVPMNDKGKRPTTNYVAVVSYAKRINMQSICNIAADEDNDMQGVEEPLVDEATIKDFEARLVALATDNGGEPDKRKINAVIKRFCKLFDIESLDKMLPSQVAEANEFIMGKERVK